ncbi:MAG TPA: decarboxylating NADP(+)-dependent phosphogluconate dehydrogenase [Acidimicrobiia bacterium]|nr:decarboxylating NADP(+)-dependent phosphogluconate dehydrogenase [Acidimicrobiia bacterium]
MSNESDIGLIGLGVMGANLALNLADSGNRVAVYNRTTSVTDEFMAGEAADKEMVATTTVEDLAGSLATPRVILLMVSAGPPVDYVISDLMPFLEEGDIIIDGGNSLYTDTKRRYEELAEKGVRFVGAGVSGGAEGARYGPSIMPGGDPGAWPVIEPILKGIAAKAPDGAPCCEWLGEGGAGHFVKMVHNGIEYGDMQVIAEAYDLMRRGLGMEPAAIGEVFAQWNQGRLQSYLVEITADIMTVTEDGVPLIDLILDAAGQKGTGKWTVVASMEAGQPTTLVAEAVYARIVSSNPALRARAAERFDDPIEPITGISADDIESALYASKIISYAQGFRLLQAASEEEGWGLDMGTIASIWRAGCIIRAGFLEDITAAYARDPELADLVEADFFTEALRAAEPAWRRVVATSVESGIPAPAYSSALAYFDGMRSLRLPASLIQAQRDYFGAHTFERTDRARGEFYHHEW